jgi:ferredoxin-nitrite reductase
VGFVAKLIKGKKCFDVYVGGTLGKTPFKGIKILESMPAENYLNALYAVMSLFYEHGNYQDRSKARIKFIIEAKGEDEFRKLFLSYYASGDKLSSSISGKSGFASDYKGQITTIRIPYGVVKPSELDELIKLLEEYHIKFIRLTRERNIIVSVSKESLTVFKDKLKSFNRNYTGESFRGLITTCIGGKVCDIGITDSPGFGDKVAEILDEYFIGKPDLKAKLRDEIIRAIKISGCPNSCGYNKIAKLGLSGVKSKNEGGESVEMCRFATLNTEFTYSESLKTKPLSQSELTQIVAEFIANMRKLQ